MEAANGILMLGLSTSALFAVRDIRTKSRDSNAFRIPERHRQSRATRARLSQGGRMEEPTTASEAVIQPRALVMAHINPASAAPPAHRLLWPQNPISGICAVSWPGAETGVCVELRQ